MSDSISPEDIGEFFASERQEMPKAEDLAGFFAREPLEKFKGSQFLAGRMWLTATGSTNVHSFKYDPKGDILVVVYMGGRGKWRGKLRYYAYSGCDMAEAESMADAISRGVWVWNNLRVRKTLRGTHKPVTFIEAVSEISPDWLLDWKPGEEGIPVEGEK